MKIPNGHQVLMPYMIMDGALQFIDFIKNVFDAQITHQSTNADGTAGHCEAQIGGCTIMFSNTTNDWTSRTADMFIYVGDADETYRKALEAGASTVMPMADQPYGRSGGVKDSFGNIWWLTSVK